MQRRDFLSGVSTAGALALLGPASSIAARASTTFMYRSKALLVGLRPAPAVMRALLPSEFEPDARTLWLTTGINMMAGEGGRGHARSAVSTRVTYKGVRGSYLVHKWSEGDDPEDQLLGPHAPAPESAAISLSIDPDGSALASTTGADGRERMRLSTDLESPTQFPPYWGWNRDIFARETQSAARRIVSYLKLNDIKQWRAGQLPSAGFVLDDAYQELTGLRNAEISAVRYLELDVEVRGPVVAADSLVPG